MTASRPGPGALTALLSVLALAPACGFDRSGVALDDAPDGAPDASLECFPIAVSNFDPCALPEPQDDLLLGNDNWVLDTDDVTLTDEAGGQLSLGAVIVDQAGGRELLVIATNQMLMGVSADLVITGRRPVAIVAFGSVQVAGEIVASGIEDEAGPGADDAAACGGGRGQAGQAQVDGQGSPGGSGGGGGGFGAVGGTGSPLHTADAAPTLGGVSNGNPNNTPLRGGCSGGNGGGGDAGLGGGGGGGVQLVAGGTIAFLDGAQAAVNGGGGGGGLDQAAGGGGGGSGGALLLEASAIVIGGALTANGGGGGQGDGLVDGELGADGREESASASAGGSDPDAGLAGGDGGALEAPAENGAIAPEQDVEPSGGGGGGGGVGRIIIRSNALIIQPAAIISPAPVTR